MISRAKAQFNKLAILDMVNRLLATGLSLRGAAGAAAQYIRAAHGLPVSISSAPYGPRAVVKTFANFLVRLICPVPGHDDGGFG